MIRDIDYRFKLNLFFYLIGLVSSPYFTWRFSVKSGTIIKISVVGFYFVLLSICHAFSFPIMIMISGVGVFAVLFVCEAIAKIVFPVVGSQNWQNKKRDVSLIKNIVTYVSYGSMACYMFHRLFFWLGELLWNPVDPTVKWLYMAGVVFPVMIVLSYYIQFGYDRLVKEIIKRS